MGVALMFLITVQVVLGYRHHIGYKIMRPTPKTTASHVYLGRIIILGGCVNVWL